MTSALFMIFLAALTAGATLFAARPLAGGRAFYILLAAVPLAAIALYLLLGHPDLPSAFAGS